MTYEINPWFFAVAISLWLWVAIFWLVPIVVRAVIG